MMVTNLKIFMKFIAGSCIVCRTLAQQYDNFVCTELRNECPNVVCESRSNQKSILPVDSIPLNACSLTISTFGNGSLVITSTDMFQKFMELHTLKIRLHGSLQISEKLSNLTGMENLTKVLFDIPKLNTLSIEYKEFSHKSYSWMLPPNIDKLYLSNGTFEFDLRHCYRLSSLRLNYNELSKMPLFHDPLPPLEILDLRYNPLDQFTLNDIAVFCKLKYFAMDMSGINNCECKKLTQWIIKLKEWGDFTFDGSINCHDSVGNSADCTIQLEDAILKRKKCLPGDWSNDVPLNLKIAQTQEHLFYYRDENGYFYLRWWVKVGIVLSGLFFCCCVCSSFAFAMIQFLFSDQGPVFGFSLLHQPGMLPGIPVPMQAYPLDGGWSAPY